MLHFKIACSREGFVVDRVQPMSSTVFNPHDHRDQDINDDDDDFLGMEDEDDDDGLDFETLSEPLQDAFENFLEDCDVTDELGEAVLEFALLKQEHHHKKVLRDMVSTLEAIHE